MAHVEEIVDLWVTLAVNQREYGSHLEPSGNRIQMKNVIARSIVRKQMHVAFDDEKERVLGFVMYTVETNVLEQTVTRGFIEYLYVIPSRQNEGIGTTLLDVAENALRKSGISTIAVSVLAQNTIAQEFYNNNGYEPHRLTVEKSIENDTHSKGEHQG